MTEQQHKICLIVLIFLVKISTSNKLLIKTNLPLNNDDDDDDDDYINTTLKTLDIWLAVHHSITFLLLPT